MIKFDIHKQFKSHGKIVDIKLNATCDEGKIIAVYGKSGVGKSSLLRMLSGLTTPDSGVITVGKEVWYDSSKKENVKANKRSIGFLFQDYSLFPNMSVLKNILYGVEGEPDQELIDRIVEIGDLKDLLDRKPETLSGGQQQRVALARALVFEPRLVLMDEPLGALDKKLREQMQYEIKHIHEQIGITVVYVTHDQNEALTMSNRIAVFNDGKIQQISSPDILYEKPENAFVAQFIGENNQIKGKVKSINGEMCVVKTEKGEEIKSLKVNVNSVGDASTVSLRPERVEINSSDSSFENSFEAKVKELIYLGDHIRTRVEVCGNDQFIVKVPNSYKGANLKEGTSVKLSWKASDSRALDLR